jgi:CHAT domain-containing protein/tetratricopeptide (TPR) repeat protein
MGAHDRFVALGIAVFLLALALAPDSFAQWARPGAARASMDTYLPELQRLQQKGDLPGMERVARQAVSELQAQLGPKSPEVSKALRWLSGVLHSEGRDAEAESLVRRALAIDEAVLGASAVTAMDLNGVADLLWEQKHYAEAEPFARRALAMRETTLGPEHPETAASANNLAEVLKAQGRYADAEPFYRRALAIREKTLGPEHQSTAISLSNLAAILKAQDRNVEAEPLMRRAAAIIEKRLGPEHSELAIYLENLASVIENQQGRDKEAEALRRRALAINEKALGPEHPNTAESLNRLASTVAAQGHLAEAEPLMRRALAINEAKLGPEHHNSAALMNNLAGMFESQGRYAEAEPLYRRALAIDEKARGPEHPETATDLNNFGLLLHHMGRNAEAEPLLRRALAINEKVQPQSPITAASLSVLAGLLLDEGHPRDAEPLYRRALAIDEKIFGPDNSGILTELNNLAYLLSTQGRYTDADPMFRRALVIAERMLGPEHHLTAGTRSNLGLNDTRLGKFADATANYRLGCRAESSIAGARDQSGDATHAAQGKANRCWTRLSLVLWDWSAQGGGSTPNDRPEALKLEAFAAGQRAVQSAAGDAMARSAALTAATSAAVGAQAQAYEAALLRRDGLDQQFARAAASAGKEGVEKRQTLEKARDQAVAEIARLETDLKAKAPLYWDYRSPEPIAVAALQAKTGADAALLHDEEALIVFLAASGKDKGLAFAVTKERAAWARLNLTGDEIKARVIKLRGQIDPEGYGVPITAPGQNGAAGAEGGYGAFDRQASYELYQALLGDAAIQAVIKDKSVLLFVPSGALTSLPPGLLVTAPPSGGRAGDTDPAALRATAWLLRSKAVALLPAVSSLRTLRQIISSDRGVAPDPLLAFADPDFDRPARPKQKRSASAAARGFASYYRDGVPLAEALDYLPRLPGTRIEGEALERALHAGAGSLLTGRDASKAQLMARNKDGRLFRVRVLEFATHGLVAGDASDLAEPALALAAGATPADELLLASEASTLKLNADWVLLSACNTASPDAPEAQGLSGLSRAFFYAGARSLLVSHWRVRDDVAPRLIPAMLLAERENPSLTRAQALRQASLAILDDATINAVSPSAWAPFTLIGEAAR